MNDLFQVWPGTTGNMRADHKSQTENEFRNIKLKLKGPNRYSELQAVKALIAMSVQQNLYQPESVNCSTDRCKHSNNDSHKSAKLAKEPIVVQGLHISMTEEEFKELAEKEGIKDVIGEPICKLCGGLFSGPLGIALHSCPAMKRQTFRCEVCGEDKWKTKANLYSHVKWCRKRLSMKLEKEVTGAQCNSDSNLSRD